MAVDTALKIALAPLLAGQALAVRRRALILPEAGGARDGVEGDGPPLRLLIVGDSSAAGVGAATQDEALAGQLVSRLAARHRVHWRLIAHTGDTTAKALTRLDTEPAGRFDLAVTALGVNDVTHMVPLGRWLEAQGRLRQRLREQFAVARVIASGLPPMGDFPALPQPLRRVLGLAARRFDTALASALSRDPAATHVKFDMPLTPDLMAKDGFHPGPDGYALWAESLLPALDGAHQPAS